MSKDTIVIAKVKDGSFGSTRVPLFTPSNVGYVPPHSSVAYYATRHPGHPRSWHMALCCAVSSHEPLFTPPPAPFLSFSAMARPPLSCALSRLSLCDLDSPPSRPRLLSSLNFGTMQSIMAAIAALNRTVVDIKLSVRSTYNAVCTGVKQNEEMAMDLTHTVSQLSCQDSRIDDLEKNFFELMGKVDMLQEDMVVLTGKT